MACKKETPAIFSENFKNLFFYRTPPDDYFWIFCLSRIGLRKSIQENCKCNPGFIRFFHLIKDKLNSMFRAIFYFCSMLARDLFIFLQCRETLCNVAMALAATGYDQKINRSRAKIAEMQCCSDGNPLTYAILFEVSWVTLHRVFAFIILSQEN